MEVIFLDSIDNGTWSIKGQVRMEQNYMRWFVDMKNMRKKYIIQYEDEIHPIIIYIHVLLQHKP